MNAAFDHSEKGANYIYFPIEDEPIVIKPENETEKIAVCGNHCGYCFFTKCGGCDTPNDFCSFATLFKDRKCPNVTCCKEKGINGCYECELLETCKDGFFKGNQSAKASSIFIKKEGKDNYEKAIKKMMQECGKDLVDFGDEEAQIKVLYEYLKK